MGDAEITAYFTNEDAVEAHDSASSLCEEIPAAAVVFSCSLAVL